MRTIRSFSSFVLASASLSMIAAGCAQDVPTAPSEADENVQFAAAAFTTADDQGCAVAAHKPSLWFPLDSLDAVGNSRDAAEGLDGRIVTGNGAHFEDGPVGTHLVFDGATYVQVDDADRIDSRDGGFSFGAWVNPATSLAGTIASHGQVGAAGTWRLLARNDSDLVFEVCDGAGCASQVLMGGAPVGAWSYVMLSANVLAGDDGNFVNFTLKSNAGSDGELVLNGSTPVDSRFGFRVPAPMSIGAALVPLMISSPPTPTEEGLDVPYGPVEPFSGGIDEAMYFDHVVAEGAFGELAGALPGGICEDCIHDITPPTIVCPGDMTVPAGVAITPLPATATDNCDAHPTILIAMSSTVPTKEGDITTITYTAIDGSGNQASCTSQVQAYAPPPVSNKTTITGGSCQLGITPGGTVISGSAISIDVTNNSFQCTGGTCDITRTFYLAEPGSPWGSGNRYVGTLQTNNMTSNSGPHGSHSANVFTGMLLDTSSAIAIVEVTAKDSLSHAVLKTWVCSTTVAVEPTVNSYCGLPIGYWRNAVDTGQVNLLVLDRYSWGNASPWFDGTNDADLIIGNVHANKIRGHGGNDCIWGGDGVDRIHGNEGNDRIEGGPGGDFIWGDIGQDTIWGGADRDEIHGDDNSDWIDGGSESDWLYGDVDDDTIFGGGGDDRIWGGAGTDTIDAGEHNDRVWGEDQPDTIIGGMGCDRIEGGGGDDDIQGNGGGDRIRGNGGSDDIFGGDANDYIRGDSGSSESLGGGEGDDLICGDAGINEAISGQGGYDECNAGPGWASSCELSSNLDCDDSVWMYSQLTECQ